MNRSLGFAFSFVLAGALALSLWGLGVQERNRYLIPNFGPYEGVRAQVHQVCSGKATPAEYLSCLEEVGGSWPPCLSLEGEKRLACLEGAKAGYPRFGEEVLSGEEYEVRMKRRLYRSWGPSGGLLEERELPVEVYVAFGKPRRTGLYLVEERKGERVLGRYWLNRRCEVLETSGFRAVGDIQGCPLFPNKPYLLFIGDGGRELVLLSGEADHDGDGVLEKGYALNREGNFFYLAYDRETRKLKYTFMRVADGFGHQELLVEYEVLLRSRP